VLLAELSDIVGCSVSEGHCLVNSKAQVMRASVNALRDRCLVYTLNTEGCLSCTLRLLYTLKTEGCLCCTLRLVYALNTEGCLCCTLLFSCVSRRVAEICILTVVDFVRK
jgi:hypothetical protein